MIPSLSSTDFQTISSSQDSSYSSFTPTDSPVLTSTDSPISLVETIEVAQNEVFVVALSDDNGSAQPVIVTVAHSVATVSTLIMKKKKGKGKNWLTLLGRKKSNTPALKAPHIRSYLEAPKITRFHELTISSLIQDLTLFYHPKRKTSNIQSIGFELFSSIIVPEIHMENCISTCFRDPVKAQDSVEGEEISDPSAFLKAEEKRRGKVHESFQKLQEESSHHVADPIIVGGAYTNNYPENIKKLNINCDSHCLMYFPQSNCHLCVVTDGCGPGQNSRDAAQIAVAVCTHYIRDRLNAKQTLESLTQVIINALAEAHKQLIFELSPPKTTTININVSFTSLSGDKYLLVVGLGDSKCYLTCFQDNGIPATIDLSQNGRPGTDMTNSGGALGGYYPNPWRSENYVDPNLGNLSVICCKLPLTREYFISTMTDGLSDCLSPERLQFEIRQAHSLIPEDYYAKSWNDLPPHTRRNLDVMFSTQRFSSIFARALIESKGDLDKTSLSLVNYAKATTMGVRTWIAENPKRRARYDVPFNCGKADHTLVTIHKICSEGSLSPSSSSSSSTSYTLAGPSSSSSLSLPY